MINFDLGLLQTDVSRRMFVTVWVSCGLVGWDGAPQCSPDWLWNHKAAESALQLELLGQAPTYLGPKVQFVALISFVFKWWSEPVRLATHWVLICSLVFFMPCTLKRTHVCMWVDGTKCTRLTAAEAVTTGNFSPLNRIIKSIPASPQITIIFKFQASVHPKKKKYDNFPSLNYNLREGTWWKLLLRTSFGNPKLSKQISFSGVTTAPSTN